jgi:hypothetical protein
MSNKNDPELALLIQRLQPGDAFRIWDQHGIATNIHIKQIYCTMTTTKEIKTIVKYNYSNGRIGEGTVQVPVERFVTLFKRFKKF